jgi:predicted enzyme related to lactoylglutathione lyase
MPRVVHFELHADNPERAIEFYSSVLGWGFDKWDGPMDYWLITTGPPNEPGINGGMIRRHPSSGDKVIAYVCTIDVPDLDSYSAKALATGAAVALPKMPIPGVGWLGYFKDPEGNIFGMMQRDPAAR